MLKVGVTYVIPPIKKSASESSGTKQQSPKAKSTIIGTTINEPLFGKQLANVKVTSNRLAGACFYVVSGHGGPDPGAIGKVGKYELHEDEYAYDIALRLARNLMQEGAEVRIIIQDAKDGIRDDSYLSNSKRETCMGDPIPLNQVQRLQQRCDKINALYRKDRKNYSYCRAIFILFTKGEVKMLFLLLVVFQEAFHQPFGECLTIGIHHQPTLIERILDITQLHKDGSGSGMGKYV